MKCKCDLPKSLISHSVFVNVNEHLQYWSKLVLKKKPKNLELSCSLIT